MVIDPEEKLMGSVCGWIQGATKPFASSLDVPQRAFLMPESTQAQNRSGLGVFILKMEGLT